MRLSRRFAGLAVTTALCGASAPALGFQPPDDDAAAGETILFEADDVYRDDENGPLIARGDVRAYFGDRYLRADRLTYDPQAEIVTAEGDVSITDAAMETVFAGKVILSGDLRDGIVQNFSALLADNARLAAQSAVEERGARTRLSRAVYTACNVCGDDGEAKVPTWRIKSLRVTRDKERKVVRFHHAFFELKGVPILYTPFLQGPDPSVDRQSGFLTPAIGASSRLGFNLELPYYFAISDSQDATFRPRYTAEDGVLWRGELRRRDRRAYNVLDLGVIDVDNGSNEFDPDTDEEDIPGVRWHYFGRGYRDFGEHWRASYDVERVSDDTYFRQYNVQREGDLRLTLPRTETNQLRSNARLARVDSNSRLTIDNFLFQGLRPVDDASTTPYILPLIDFQYRPNIAPLGGALTLGANIASILRTGGVDSQRYTASAEWGRDVITRGGHRFHVFARARADAYFYQDLDQGTEICDNPDAPCARDGPIFNEKDSTEFASRLAPTVGAEWTFPVVGQAAGARLLIEPRVQLLASPARQNDADIINEDSQSIEFDYAGLFDFNKATGFDAFEDGQRANIGVRMVAEWPSDIVLEAALGRQYRLQETNAFDASSGIGETSSDIVGSVNFRLGERFGFENRFRYDVGSERFLEGFSRLESIGYFRTRLLEASASYTRLNEENAANNLVRREELRTAGRLNATDNFFAGAGWRLDLVNDRTIRQDFTLGYQDECMTIAATYRRDRTRTTNLRPDEAFLITFTLKSLVTQ